MYYQTIIIKQLTLNDTFVFKDSYNFLPFSLDKLSSELRSSTHKFPLLAQSSLCQNEGGEFDAVKHKFLASNGKSVLPYGM